MWLKFPCRVPPGLFEISVTLQGLHVLWNVNRLRMGFTLKVHAAKSPNLFLMVPPLNPGFGFVLLFGFGVLFETGFHDVAQVGLKPTILLP
jgi:hypothetical protein